MMIEKFTPGPWSVYDCGAFPGIDADSGKSIVIWGCGSDESGVRGMANAHLIAAAPCLYEALYRLMTECIIDGKENEAGYDCWIHQAKAALAKANGETK